MDEELCRTKKNESLYRENHKLDIIDTLLYALFLVIFVFIVLFFSLVDVKAKTQSTDLNNSIFADCGGSRVYNKYCDFKATRSPQYASRSLNTTISGTTDQISFGFQRQMSAYAQYIVNVYAMSTDFRNNDLSVVVYGSNVENSINNVMNNASYSFVSKNQIQVVIPENNYTYHYIVITGDSLTGVNSYGVKKITLSWDDGATDMSGVISNQTQNTQDIINNANSNTEEVTNKLTDLMNANNLISDDNINMQREQLNSLCSNSYKFNFTKGKAFYSNGSLFNSALSFYTEEYVPIGNGVTKLYIQNANDNGAGGNIIIYDSSKNYLDYWGVRNQSFNLPSGASYFRIASTYPGVIVTKNKACEKTEDKIYDSLTSDDIGSGTGSDFFNDFDTSDPGGISSIVTKPLVLINNLLSNNSSCSNLTLPDFMGATNVSLPSGCILWNTAPNNVVTLWNIFVCGIGSYYILKQLFKLVEELKNPDKDKVEVMDL